MTKGLSTLQKHTKPIAASFTAWVNWVRLWDASPLAEHISSLSRNFRMAIFSPVAQTQISWPGIWDLLLWVGFFFHRRQILIGLKLNLTQNYFPNWSNPRKEGGKKSIVSIKWGLEHYKKSISLFSDLSTRDGVARFLSISRFDLFSRAEHTQAAQRDDGICTDTPTNQNTAGRSHFRPTNL